MCVIYDRRSSRNLKLDKKRVKQSRHPAPGRSSPPVGTNDENKSSCRAENLPVSPSIIQGIRPFLALQLAEGRRPAKGRQPWHTVGWRLGERTRSSLAWALAVLKLCACDRRASRPSFPVISSLKPQITALWNWWAVRRDPAELSGADTLKWTGPGEMANSLISEGTATFWRLAADNVCSL